MPPQTQQNGPKAPPAPSSDRPPADGPPTAPLPGFQLVFSDEFEGSAVDTSRWRVSTGPRRDALMTPDALTVADGALRFTTYTEGGVHRTGFISSEGAFATTTGWFEARIFFDDAPGEWCSFWLMTPTIGRPLGDPATAGAEIDVVEHRVTDDSGWQLQDYLQETVLWDGYGPEGKQEKNITLAPGGEPVQGAWHVYAVHWTDSSYEFYVDGVKLWTTTTAVSRRTQFVNLSCEVLDRSWAGNIPADGYGTRAASTTGMRVDWVRAWKAGS
jgi:beta-glucanase (GH16 family)